MKKSFLIISVAFIILFQSFVPASAYVRLSTFNDEFAVKNDGTVWEYDVLMGEYKLEFVRDNTIFAQGDEGFYIKKDDSLWFNAKITKTGNPVVVHQKIMDDVKVAYCTKLNYKFNSLNDTAGYVVKNDGSLWAWGQYWDFIPDGYVDPAYEQRRSEKIYVPYNKAIKLDDDVIDFSVPMHRMNYIIKNDCSLWAYGKGMFPGYEEQVSFDVPTKIMDGVVSIGSTYILKTDGSVVSYENGYISEPIITDVRKITSGDRYTVAIKNDNTLWAWGNVCGYWNDEWTQNMDYWPVPPSENRYYDLPVKVGEDVKDIYCYDGNTILKTDGSLWAYGRYGIKEPTKIMQLMSVVINGKNVVGTGTETILNATYYDKDGNAHNDEDITWICEDEETAQIIPKGNGVVVTGLKPGRTVIKAIHNESGEETSIDLIVDNYKFSLEDTLYIEKDSEEGFNYTLSLLGKPISIDDASVSWRIENTDSTPAPVLTNLVYRDEEEYSRYIGFKAENEGECVLIASVNGKDVKRIHVKVVGSLFELIEKEAVLRAKVLSESERYDYYKNKYVTAPHHVIDRLDVKTVKANNTINQFFEKGFTMRPYYEIVLWDILNSDEYDWATSENKENVTMNVSEYLMNLGVDRLDKAIESSDNDVLKKLTENCPVNFSGLISAFKLSLNTEKDFKNAIANMTMLLETSSRKIKTIEAIKNSTDDENLKKACQNILDRYQEVLDKNTDDIIDKVLNDSSKSAFVFLKEKAGSAILKAALGKIYIAGKTTLELTNLIFNTDDISEKAVMLMAYTDIEDAMKKALGNAQSKFKANPCYDTAAGFTNLADSYKALMMDECDATKEYISAVESGNDSYSQILWGDMTPDHSLRPFGKNPDYDNFRKVLQEAKQTINKTNFYSADGIDIAEYISEVRSLEKSDWAVDTIDDAINKGILPGYMQCNYKENITRAEFCTLLTNMITKKTGKSIDELIEEKGVQIKSPFEDTFYEYVDYMYKLGIVNGTGANKFSPLENISREQAATMLARTAGLLGCDTKYNIDVETTVSDWAKDGVGYVTQSGVMQGTGDGFEPTGIYTKEQAIVTMVRLFNKV